MRSLMRVATAEWRMEWRSPGAWAATALVGLYAVGGALQATTFLGLALGAGAALAMVLPLGLSLVWIASSYRASTHKAEEMVGSSPLPQPVRLAGETIGGLLVAAAVGAVGLSAAAAAFLVREVAIGVTGLPGLAGDLWLVPLIVGPALPFWAALSRIVARYLPPKGAYLCFVLLWAVGLWLRPPASLYTPGYTPVQGSELTLLGPAGWQFALHRAVVLAAGLLLGLGWLWSSEGRMDVTPKGRKAATGARCRAAGSLVLAGLVAGLLSLPGMATIISASPRTGGPGDWLAVAQASPRWRLADDGPGGGVALLASADVAWGPDLLSGVDDLADLSGVELPADWWLVEAPTTLITLDSTAGRAVLSVPESLFRFAGAGYSGIVVRRLTTKWVAWLTGADPGSVAGPFASPRSEVLDGVRLYIEWVFTASVLGDPTARAEVAAWRGLAEPPPGSAAGSPSPGGFPSDANSILTWRGGRSGWGTDGLSLALCLWSEAGAETEPGDLIEAYTLWSAGLGDPIAATPEELAAGFATVVREVSDGP